MKRNILYFILSAIFLTTTSATCSKKQANSCDNVACTMMFAMINVTIVDASGNKMVLDDAYTVRIDNNDTIKHDQSLLSVDGSYIILDDSYQKKMPNSSHTFRFIGVRNNKTIVDELYNINADCCHVSKQSGKSAVTVN